MRFIITLSVSVVWLLKVVSPEKCYCPSSNLQQEYCTAQAVILGHVRLRGALTPELDYYLVNIPHIIRRSFRLQTGLRRVVTRNNACGVKLDVGALYIMGVNEIPEDKLELAIHGCMLALKYNETNAAIRAALTKRRIDCSCSLKECSTVTCMEETQKHVDYVKDVGVAASCLERSGFCGQYNLGTGKKGGARKCCWTVDMVEWVGCTSETSALGMGSATELPPTEDMFHEDED